MMTLGKYAMLFVTPARDRRRLGLNTGALFAVHAGENSPAAMVAGLRLAYLGGAAVEFAGALVALAFIRGDSMEQR